MSVQPDGRMDNQEGEESFERFYLSEFRRVERISAGLVGRADAFDLAQEAFARTWLNWATVARGGSPLRYTIAVACNLARSAARRRRAWKRISRLLVAEMRDRQYDSSDLADISLALLPVRQAQAFLLCNHLGFTSEEAAEILGIAAPTVRVHAARARAALRELLATAPNDEGSVEGSKPLGRMK